jgi:hypothetical protein
MRHGPGPALPFPQRFSARITWQPAARSFTSWMIKLQSDGGGPDCHLSRSAL